MKTGRYALVLVLAVMFLPAFSPDAQFHYRDNGRMHDPGKRFVAEELRQGRVPEWNPRTGLGTPVVSGAIDAALHPFNVLLLALPFREAFKAWVLLSFLAAALGGRAWARALGVGDEAATLGGLVFALGGPLVSASDNVTYLTTFAALPWYFAALHAFLAAGGAARLGLLMVASFVAAAGGDPQAWGLALAVTLPYGLIAADGAWRRIAARGLLSMAAAAAAAAPALLPLIAWLGETQRTAVPDPAELARWNLSPARLPELFLPGLFRVDPDLPVAPVFRRFAGDALDDLPWYLSIYSGAGALGLAILGALRRRWAAWVLGGGAVFLWAALGPHAGFGQLALRVPLLGSFRYWEKLVVWPSLAIAVCAAAGLDALLQERAVVGKGFVRAAGIAAGALLGLAALAHAQWLVAGVAGGGAEAATLAENLGGAALHAGGILAVLAVAVHAMVRGRIGRNAGWALAGVVALDLVGGNVAAYVLTAPPPDAPPPLATRIDGSPAPRVATAFSMRLDRWPELGPLRSAWEWGRRALEPNWNVGAGVSNFRVYQGLVDGRHQVVTAALAGSGQWASAGLWGVAGVVVPGTPELATRVGARPPFETIAADPDLPAWIVRIPHRPRAYLADEVLATDEEGARAFALSAASAGATVVEGPVPPDAGRGGGEVRIVLDRPGRVELAVRAERPSLLVLNDAWSRGWSAEVDGRQVPVLRANYLVRGVWLEAGVHDVRFEFATPGLRAGLLVAALAALLVLAWGAAARWRRGTGP